MARDSLFHGDPNWARHRFVRDLNLDVGKGDVSVRRELLAEDGAVLDDDVRCRFGNLLRHLQLVVPANGLAGLRRRNVHLKVAREWRGGRAAGGVNSGAPPPTKHPPLAGRKAGWGQWSEIEHTFAKGARVQIQSRTIKQTNKKHQKKKEYFMGNGGVGSWGEGALAS